MLRGANTSNVIPGERIGGPDHRQASGFSGGRVNSNVTPGLRTGGQDYRPASGFSGGRARDNVLPGLESGRNSYRRTTSRVNDHVIPGIDGRETHTFVPLQGPTPTPYLDRRFNHVQTNSRSFRTNVRFGMREAGYIPFIGTIIGIYNFVYGLLCILHLTSLSPSLGYRYCGRGIVEMIPIFGGISLYFYDRRY